MMRTPLTKLATALVCACTFGGTVAASPTPANYSLPVLAYHDIVPGLSLSDEPQTVSVDSLVRQFAELHAKGYTPVSLAQVEAASRGEAVLPARAILLTFDDGYRSFHTHVLPLLRAYRWPATLAIIGTRVDSASVDGEPAYLTTAQLREIVGSGLVQLANHSDDLHHGVVANAWGNAQPAAVSRIWKAGGLESDAQWTARVSSDIARNQTRIHALTGQTPTALVWPYGRQNDALQAISHSMGLTLLFTLDDGISDMRRDNLQVRRYLVGRDDREGAIVAVTAHTEPGRQTIRAISLRVPDLAPSVDGKVETALSSALTTLGDLQGNVAVLDPYFREGGHVTGATFATQTLPVKVDYANRVAALAQGKAGYSSWLSVPMSPASYRSLTQEQVLALVEDAAKAMPLTGLLVEDADKVDASVISAAVSRVRKWRGDVVLALKFAGAPAPSTANATVKATGAAYLWLDAAMAADSPGMSVPVIHAFGADAVGGARSSAQNGSSHLAITGLPTRAETWLDFFSLRSMPQRRVSLEAK